jgi:hypothetical protein
MLVIVMNTAEIITTRRQSINQSIKQSIKQASKQAINQSID